MEGDGKKRSCNNMHFCRICHKFRNRTDPMESHGV
jgi:hypothetical protein